MKQIEAAEKAREDAGKASDLAQQAYALIKEVSGGHGWCVEDGLAGRGYTYGIANYPKPMPQSVYRYLATLGCKRGASRRYLMLDLQGQALQAHVYKHHLRPAYSHHVPGCCQASCLLLSITLSWQA